MKTKSLLIGLMIAGTAITSCKKEEEKGSMNLTMQMSKGTGTVQKTAAGTLQFTQGSVTVSEVRFEGEFTNGEELEFSSEQITRIDLATGVASPAFSAEIPAGNYEELELEVEIYDESDVPSVIAEGTYTNSAGDQIPIRFEFNSGETFEVEGEAVTITEDAQFTAKINFDPLEWFGTVTTAMLDNAERVNGVILINEETNESIFSLVADRLDDLTEVEFD